MCGAESVYGDMETCIEEATREKKKKVVPIKLKGRTISRGCAEGEVLLSRDPISFLGSVDLKPGLWLRKNTL